MPFKDLNKKKEYQRLYQKKNRAKMRLARMKSYYKNRDKELKKVKEYYKKNEEKYKLYRREWRTLNLEHEKKIKKIYYEKNKKHILEMSKLWHKANCHKIKKRADKEYHKKYRQRNIKKILFKNKLRRERLRGSIGTHTLKDWEKLKCYYEYRCQLCNKQEPEIKLTRDHIIPITKKGNNYIGNILPLCGRCNSIKHNNFFFETKMRKLKENLWH